MDKLYGVNTPKLVCCVCKKKADFVACSTTGAFTLSYCNDCADKGLEPYDLLVSMGPYEDFNDSYRENVVDPTLKFYGKTVEQFNKDVLDEMNSYLEYMKSRSLPSDDIREENHIGEENEWFSDPFDLQNEDNI